MAQLQSYDIRSIDEAEVLRYMGYSGQKYSPELEGRIRQTMQECLDVSQPRGLVQVFEVAGRGTSADGRPEVRLEGTALTLVGDSMREHMDGAVAVGVLAVTLGMANERMLKRLSLTDHIRQVIFDAASTTLVECAADAAEASIVRQAADRGLFTNFRFSPGYGDMPMQTQPVLLQTLDAQRRLGITLTPTLLMTPTKSVTAVVGMFHERQPSTHGSCKGCPCFDFCTIRPTGRTCRG